MLISYHDALKNAKESYYQSYHAFLDVLDAECPDRTLVNAMSHKLDFDKNHLEKIMDLCKRKNVRAYKETIQKANN